MSKLFKVCCVNVESDSVVYCNAQRDNKDIGPVKNERAASATEEKAKAKAKALEKASAEAEAEAVARAQIIIENAKIDAEKIKRQAFEEALVSIAEAKENGYKEGSEKAFLEVQRENQETLNEIKLVMDRLEKEKDKLFAGNKKDIIELSFRIAEKVINQKLITDEKSYLKIYEKAVKDLKAQKWVKLSVSKQEVEFVTKNSDYLLAMIDGAERLEIEVLESAPAGVCIIETSDKIVDGSVHTQLELLRNAVQTA